MPIGVLTDCLSHLVGGILGGLIGKRMPENLRVELDSVIGTWAIALGIVLIPRVSIIGVVAISLAISYIIGYLLKFDERINSGILFISRKVFRKNGDFDIEKLSVLIVLTAFGGSGIVGAMTESLTGDSSIILARAMIAFITSIMFGASIGTITAIVALPGFISLMTFYFSAKLIMPLMTDSVYANFTASGGVLTLLSGLKLLKVSKAKPMNAVLILFLCIPITKLWELIF